MIGDIVGSIATKMILIPVIGFGLLLGAKGCLNQVKAGIASQIELRNVREVAIANTKVKNDLEEVSGDISVKYEKLEAQYKSTEDRRWKAQRELNELQEELASTEDSPYCRPGCLRAVPQSQIRSP